MPAPIAIGEYAPDFHADQLLNNPNGALKLSDYTGKLIILDFWATWCQPCIAKIPEMERLQREFDGRLQFISVTSQSRTEIQQFLDRREKGQRTPSNIPYIVEDNQLKNAFPHGSIPHYVWLAGNGKVLAITGSEEVNEANIRQMLIEPVALKQKTELIRQYDRREPLLFDMETIAETNLFFNRALVGYIPGIGGGMVQTITSDSTSEFIKGQGNYRRITVRNQSVAGLYQVAFKDGKRNFRWENTILKVQEPGKLSSEKHGAPYTEWLADGNGFCYELIVPKNQAHRAWDLMKEDLRRWFPQYTATVEKRATPSICLVRTTEPDLLKSKGGEPMVNMGPFGGELRNVNLGYLVLELYIKGLKVHKKPVINLTGYRNPVDMKINADLSSLESINGALEPYGLALVEQDHEVENLVIRDSE
ncbi:TlpA family protein disulfide reductase [Parapedobacter lycopersici]|uniref:TlpA family protein disulfide reductase n=1 Tax=Parapedobacter lycopersici TaxID=1864939 RepID=UPI00214D85AF|nr:TlpA disulfide reductase family protein [Parapedobacter lycopersici]